MLKYFPPYEESVHLLVYGKRILRFLMVGYFLHLFFGLGMFLFILGLEAFFNSNSDFHHHIWSIIFSIYGLGLALFAEADALGRYQNYKQIKDTIYKIGFDTRLIRPFMYSKCQRDAVLMAVKDLGFEQETKQYFKEQGYRWYHILPDAFVKNPFIVFYGQFWANILFTKKYNRQYFLW
ncbi:MAG: hypothetical protein WBN16_09475 [Lutimonas sp.]